MSYAERAALWDALLEWRNQTKHRWGLCLAECTARRARHFREAYE